MKVYPRSNARQPARDSAAGLQAAVDACTGGTVRVPKGVYDLDAPIRLNEGVSLSGGSYVAHSLPFVFGCDSKDVSLANVRIHGTFEHGIWLAPAEDCRIGRCHVYGGTGHGIFLNDASRVMVHDNTIGSGSQSQRAPSLDKFDSGINIGPLGGTDNRLVRNKVTTTTVGGIICNNTTRTVVEDNVIEEIGGNGINTGYGIQFYLLPPSPKENTANVARRNLIKGTDGSGIYVLASPHTVVDTNMLIDVVRTQVDDGGLVVAAIAVAPEYDDANPLGTEQDTLVQNNVVLDSGQSAISFFGRGVTVRGNHCERATHGILVRGAIGCSIVQNSIRSCRQGISHWSWQPYIRMDVDGNRVDG